MLQTLPADPLARAAAVPMSPEDFLAAGGWALVLVAAALIAAVAAVVGVIRHVGAAEVDGDELLRTVRDYIVAGNLVGAIDFCRSQDSVAARVVSEGVQRLGRPLGDIQTAVAAAARLETERVRGRLDVVRTMGLAALASGILGTALGLIVVLRSDAVLPPLAAMWPALVPAAAGAGVALIVLVAYHTVAGRGAEFAAGVDTLTGDFLEMLRTPVG